MLAGLRIDDHRLEIEPHDLPGTGLLRAASDLGRCSLALSQRRAHALECNVEAGACPEPPSGGLPITDR